MTDYLDHPTPRAMIGKRPKGRGLFKPGVPLKRRILNWTVPGAGLIRGDAVDEALLEECPDDQLGGDGFGDDGVLMANPNDGTVVNVRRGSKHAQAWHKHAPKHHRGDSHNPHARMRLGEDDFEDSAPKSHPGPHPYIPLAVAAGGALHKDFGEPVHRAAAAWKAHRPQRLARQTAHGGPLLPHRPRINPVAGTPAPDNIGGNMAGYTYFGADDLDHTGNYLGYDDEESEMDRVEGDQLLYDTDMELEAIEGYEADDDAEELVSGYDPDVIGRSMKGRSRRVERLEDRLEKLQAKLASAKGTRRKRRIQKRINAVQSGIDKLVAKQATKATKKASSKGRGRSMSRPTVDRSASKAAASLAAGGGAGAAAAYLAKRGGSVPGASPVSAAPQLQKGGVFNVVQALPREGELVTIPLFEGGATSKPYANLTIATSTAGKYTTKSLTSEGITYAALRVLGFIVHANVDNTAAGNLAMVSLLSANVDGGIPLVYGQVVDIFEYASSLDGYASFFVPSIRDNPVLQRTQKVKAQLRAYTLTGKKDVVYANMMAICETIDDPQARIY